MTHHCGISQHLTFKWPTERHSSYTHTHTQGWELESWDTSQTCKKSCFLLTYVNSNHACQGLMWLENEAGKNHKSGCACLFFSMVKYLMWPSGSTTAFSGLSSCLSSHHPGQICLQKHTLPCRGYGENMTGRTSFYQHTRFFIFLLWNMEQQPYRPFHTTEVTQGLPLETDAILTTFPALT